jgi:uncharacterized protein (DUF305 family)
MRCFRVSVLLAIAATIACSRKDDAGQVRADSPAAATADTSEEGGETALDAESMATVDLLRQLADRDEALIEMSRLALTRREQLQVSADARRMLTDQRRESNRILGTLRGEFRDAYQPKISADDQTLIDSLNGAGVGEFDRTFVDGVKKHYTDDLKLIDDGLPKVKTPKVREILAEIRAQRAADAAAFSKQAPVKTAAKSGR